MESNKSNVKSGQTEKRFIRMAKHSPIKTFNNTCGKRSKLARSIFEDNELKTMFIQTYASVLFYFSKHHIVPYSIFQVFKFFWDEHNKDINAYNKIVFYPNLGLDDAFKTKNGKWLLGPSIHKGFSLKTMIAESDTYNFDAAIKKIKSIQGSLNLSPKVAVCQSEGILPFPLSFTAGNGGFYCHKRFWLPLISKLIKLFSSKGMLMYHLVYYSDKEDVNKFGPCNPKIDQVTRLPIEL